MVQSLSQPASLSPRFQRLKEVLSQPNQSRLKERVEATVGLMLLEHGADVETLLIQRTERHDDPWSGQVGLPGGRVKESDGSIRSALHREVMEEVGVDLSSDGEELGPLSVGHPMRRLEMKVQPWVYALRIRPSVSIGPEVSSAFWVSLPVLPSKRTKSDVFIRGERWTVECFLDDGKVVWGFTYRVLTELIQVPGFLSGI